MSAMGSNNECYVESLEITNNIFFLSLSSKKSVIYIYMTQYIIYCSFICMYIYTYICMQVRLFLVRTLFICVLSFILYCFVIFVLIITMYWLWYFRVCLSVHRFVRLLSVSGLDFDLFTCVFETCFSGTISADLLIFLFSFCLLVVLWLWTCCDHSVSLLVFFLVFFFFNFAGFRFISVPCRKNSD